MKHTLFAKQLSDFRKQRGYSQEQLSLLLNIKRSTLSSYEQGRAEPSFQMIQTIAEALKVSLYDLTGEEVESQYTSNMESKFRVLAVTMDSHERENIELVPIKAQAGYAGAYGNPEFVRHLPKFRLPFLGAGTYRAFEIDGDSMLPIPSGSIVIGKYVESSTELKANETYIFITSYNGILFKRLGEISKNRVFLKSDNPIFQSYSLPLSEIEEIWKTKLYMSYEFPTPDQTLNRIEKEIMDLRMGIQKLESRAV